MKSNPKGISLIVPVFNEAEGIGRVLEQVEPVLRQTGLATEIIVGDDGSHDGTDVAAAQRPSVRLLRHNRNRGYGAALKTGIRHARYDLICITDGDGTYPNERIAELVDRLQTGSVDMVIGARLGRKAAIPWLRRPAKWFVNRFAAYVAGESIEDVNSGLRVFPRSVAIGLFHLLPDGFSFTTTLTLAMLGSGYLVDYVPIQYFDRVGKSKIRPIADTFAFLQLISRIALYFAPLRVFLPLSGALLLMALLWAGASAVAFGRVADASTAVIATAGVQLAAVGLLAELINGRLASGRDEDPEADS